MLLPQFSTETPQSRKTLETNRPSDSHVAHVQQQRPKLITLSWWKWKAEIRSNHQSLPYGARQTYKMWDTSTWHTVKCTEWDSRFNSHVESLSLLKMRRFGWLLLEICLVYAFLRIWHLSRKCNRSYKDLCCRLYFHSVTINRSMKLSKYP